MQTIEAIDLKTGMIVKYGREKKRVKEVLFNLGMVQLTFEDLQFNKRALVCINVCSDFKFIANSEDDVK